MAISPLPEATTRILGATVVLNDATSVIKELVDNALDSRATSITIEISANTLDVIQLKDNGTGVGVEDRQLLCKRGCTSKIRTLDDLEKLGGSYLGFRGEALASITNLSESVTIVTRVEGELVGSTLKYGPHGKLLSSASASHPVGTTIRVQNFLTSVPVRKQSATKASDKTLSDIKQLLYRFAFARPTVRFAFKVLKGKHEKSNWSYAPCKSVDELVVATTKIVGKEVAAACKYLSADLEDPNSTDEQELTYKMSAVLLDTSSSDNHKVGTIGQFFSLDNRPIDAERGTIKEIAKLYKSFLQQASTVDKSLPAKPFICAHICCPPGSYDVNIEPAKGEVMFYQPELVLDVARKVFVQFYGELQDIQTPAKKPKHSMKTLTNPSFDLLLARKPQPDKSQLPPLGNDSEAVTASSEDSMLNSRRTAIAPSSQDDNTNLVRQDSAGEQNVRHLRDLYPMNDEVGKEHGQISIVSRDDEADDATLTGVNHMIRNPFTTAKMNTLLSPRKHGNTDEQIRLISSEGTGPPSNQINSFSDEVSALGPSVSYLPTPSKTPGRNGAYQNPSPPLRRRQSQEVEVNSDLTDYSPQSGAQRGSLDKWIKPNSVFTPARNIQTARDLLNLDGRSDTIGSDSTERQQQRHINVLSSVSPNPTHLLRKQTPFRSPLKANIPSAQHTANQHEGGSVDLTYGNHRRPVESNSDLEDVMDFEHRKRALNQRKKGVQSYLNPADLAHIQRDTLRDDPSPIESADIRDSATRRLDLVPIQDAFAARFNTVEDSASSTRSNPHQNRYLAATRNLSNRNSENRPPIPDSTIKPEEDENHEARVLAKTPSVSDPRANLLSTPNNDRTPTSKPKRIPSSRLPFESIPSSAVKPNTLAVLDKPFPDPSQLRVFATTISKSDPYIQSGKIESPVIIPFSTSTTEWQSRLENLVHNLYRSKDPLTNDESIETQLPPTIKIPLGRIIKAHIEATLQEKS